MKGIMFTEPLFHKVVKGEKTQTRRIIKRLNHALDNPKYCEYVLTTLRPKYKLNEVVYLKEPYVITGKYIIYKFGSTIGQECDKAGVKWSNKLFMPESAARYFIKITAVRAERLQDISEEDCFKEGIKLHQILRLNERWFENGLVDKSNTTTGYLTAQEAYAALIDKINGKGTWESNPWVWVYDFIKVEKQ